MVLIPLVCERVKVPVVAAGGITDGRSMAAAFALGAEGVLMGTRILSSKESPVHQNWKDAILKAEATDTVFLNRSGPGPALRALRTKRTTRIEKEGSPNIFGEFARTQDVYFKGDLEAGIALTGQVAGRITEVKPVRQVFEETMAEFEETLARMNRVVV
jgi:enoyl-[acyl-carrier protein] reductase II